MTTTVVPDDYTGSRQFVHWHNHTVFSTLDGVATPEQYAARCQQWGYPAMSATEHGHMGSVPDMMGAFKKFGVKYVAGCFLPDQPVYLSRGVSAIADVTRGDNALTHALNLMPVLNLQVRPYSGRVLRIKAWGVEDQVCTPEHPLMVREVVRKETARGVRKETARGVWEERISVGWRRADEMFRQKYHRTYDTERSQDRSNKRRYRFYLCVPRLPQESTLESINLCDHIFSDTSDATPIIVDGTITAITYCGDNSYKTTKHINLPEQLPLCNDLLWIMGLWLAEGSISDGGPVFSLCSDEYHFYERIADYFAGFGINVTCRTRDGAGESRPRQALDVQVCSVYFGRLFAALFGVGFANKQIRSEWLRGLGAAQAAALVDGIFAGDAKIGPQQSILKLNNRTLVWQVRMLMTKFDVPQYSAVTPLECNNSDNVSYALRKRESGHFYYDYDDDWVYLPVYAVHSEEYEGDVYNMEVYGDNSYFTGVAVHNCEIYFNDFEPFRREHWLGKSLRPLKDSEKPEDRELYTSIMRNRHLTLIAMNDVGFANLIKLTTQAYQTGYYYRPRIWFDKLCEYREGIFVLSGCLNGPVCHELRRTDPDGKRTPRLESPDKRGAIDWVRRFKRAFGENYGIEVQMPGILDDDWVFRQQIAIADHFKIPVYLANDCHYLRREDFELQKIMMAIDQKTTVDDPDLFHVNSDEQFMKSRAELWARFKNNGYSKGVSDSVFEQMCDNTLLLAERCRTPKFDSNPKYPALENADAKLRELVVTRLVKRGLHRVDRRYLIDGREVTYRDQMEIELGRIIDKGFSSYFLITQDLISFGNRNHWPFSPRGSAGGSVVNFLLGISPIDPLKWGLSFDRFLSPSRGGFMLNVKMPEPIKRDQIDTLPVPEPIKQESDGSTGKKWVSGEAENEITANPRK